MKISKRIWSTLALSAMIGATGVSVVAQPPGDAPKGDNPPNNERAAGDRNKGNRGDRPGRGGGRDGRNPLMMMEAEQLQRLLGENLTDAQKAQLAGAAEERDQAIKAAQERFKAQLMQATGLSEQELGQKMREGMQKMRENRGDRPNGDRPNGDRPGGDRTDRPNRPDKANRPNKPNRPDKAEPAEEMAADEA